MEIWFLIIISLSISFLLRSIFGHLLFISKRKFPHNNLPPGPLTLPVIGNFLWLKKSFFDIEPILKSLHAKHGPLVTLRIGSRPAIFVADRSLAHQALVQNGAVYSDRPPASATNKFVSSNQHNISSATYGPTWRVLRRNLTAEILHPSRVKSYSHARKWVLEILLTRLENQMKSSDRVPVVIVHDFQYAMFCLLVLMCFGDKLDESQIRKIEEVQRGLLLNLGKFNILNFWPSVTKIVFRKRWQKLFEIRQAQEDVLIPLIRTRKRVKEEALNKAKEDLQHQHHHLNNDNNEERDYVVAYADTLLDLELPDGKRKLNEGEMISLCSEFLNAGTDTTSTALQWTMANLVKYPEIQEKLFMEIKGVIGDGSAGDEEVKEEDLQKMPYLKAVILEGLRRHPPGHFVLPHAVTEDTVLGNYLIPKNGVINFMVAEMGWDSKVWEDPMTFKPERFLNGGDQEAFDITGSREIKMMPFGVGRRICPGNNLAMLHLEYFVANLIWKFEWKAVDGDDVDLSEKQEFVVVMKNPLRAQLCPRLK